MIRKVIWLLLIPIAAIAWQEGHGGDAVAENFVYLATQISTQLEAVNPDLLPDPHFVSIFKSKISVTHVSSALRVQSNHVEVDVINLPDENPQRIVIGRKRWLDPHLKTIEKGPLVIHEYLSLMGIDDQNYAMSIRIWQTVEKKIQAEGGLQ